MEPITHFLTGACLGRMVNRKTALATATMTLAAEAPDLDMLGQFKGPVFGFAHHRGFTHSILGAVLMAGLVLGVVYLWWRLRGRKVRYPNLPPRWGLLFLLAFLAGLSHVLLDFTNNYGVRPFWPFVEKWYSWDIVFIFEPVLFLLLLAGLILPGLFSLISEEIGSRGKGPHGQWGAALALLGVLALYGVRDYEHRRALSALNSRTYENADPIRVSAYPYWWSPFRWNGVVETTNFYATMAVDSLAPEVDPLDRIRIYYKPEETDITLAAKKSYLGQVYLDWAKYPLTETERVDSGDVTYVVHFRDLRFDYPDRAGGRNLLSAAVELDRNLKVVSYIMGQRRQAVGSASTSGH